MLMRTDPFRELDRLTQQGFRHCGSTSLDAHGCLARWGHVPH